MIPTHPMNLELPVVNPAQTCHQCGGCCEFIPMNQSPAQLHGLVTRGAEEQSWQWYEARQIARMLEGRCLGSITFPNGEKRYAYGPCRNLVKTDQGGICAIHDIKPSMCHTYPFYVQRRHSLGVDHGVEDFFPPLMDNPGYIRGCGYNLNPDEAYSVDELRAMVVPLEAHEQ